MATKTMTDIFGTAFKLHTLGYSVIPSGGGDKGKAPIVNWTEFQYRQPTDEELQDWQDKEKPELWGIVTGKVSGIVVVDADNDQARNLLEDHRLVPHILTPRGGAHYYFNYPSYPVKTCAGLLPSIDIRGDGGFVNVIGGKYQIVIFPEPNHVYPWKDLPAPIAEALKNGKTTTLPTEQPENQVIPEGQRNAMLASLAGTMRRRGMSQGAIEVALLIENNRCQPPLSENEVKTIASSVARYAPNTGNTSMYMYDGTQQNEPEAKRNKNATENATGEHESIIKTQQEPLSKRIEDWVTSTAGWFDTPELDRDLGIVSITDKNNRREAILRLEAKRILERHQKISKQFRYVNTRVTSLAFKTASNTGILPIKWPLSIEKYVNIFPGNMAVVAGSPNAGKTALLLNFIYLNQDNFPIYYLCSEMGAVELRDRLSKFPDMVIEDWKFEAIERGSDFADVIRPDSINLIDYLEMTTELYQVNSYLTAISHRLGSGVAIVALQKKQGARYGRGQEFGMEKPKLYMSMDSSKLQIVKGKSWATKYVNPNGLQVNFKITDGCQFEATGEWDWTK